MIYENIKKERERLGLTQPAFALIAGAAKRTVIDWEKGVSSPTAVQIAAMAAHGADALFIITGQRSQAVAEVELLSPRQKALLSNYEASDDVGKKHIESTASLLSQQKLIKKRG